MQPTANCCRQICCPIWQRVDAAAARYSAPSTEEICYVWPTKLERNCKGTKQRLVLQDLSTSPPSLFHLQVIQISLKACLVCIMTTDAIACQQLQRLQQSIGQHLQLSFHFIYHIRRSCCCIHERRKTHHSLANGCKISQDFTHICCLQFACHLIAALTAMIQCQL